jgi:hypothetical protein
MFAALGLGEVLWSLLVVFLMVQYLVLTFTVVVDLFRSDDLSGAKKALWALALFFFPLIALIAYLVVRGDGIGKRNEERARSGRDAVDSYIRDVARTASPATELQAAKALLDDGTITAAEFEGLKIRILG